MSTSHMLGRAIGSKGQARRQMARFLMDTDRAVRREICMDSGCCGHAWTVGGKEPAAVMDQKTVYCCLDDNVETRDYAGRSCARC